MESGSAIRSVLTDTIMRFIHTADWQLGLKLRFVDPEKAAQLLAKVIESNNDLQVDPNSKTAHYLVRGKGAHHVVPR